jgi:hypothetical protein
MALRSATAEFRPQSCRAESGVLHLTFSARTFALTSMRVNEAAHWTELAVMRRPVIQLRGRPLSVSTGMNQPPSQT